MNKTAVENRVNILGVSVNAANLRDAVATLEGWRDDGERNYVCCVSVHGIVTAQRDTAIRNAINGSGFATTDGMPLAWWCQRAGHSDAKRVPGTELMMAMCSLGAQRGHRHYFYGGSPRVLRSMVKRLQEQYPGLIIAGFRSPPFRALTPEEIVADIATINATHPDFVWIGLGMPKQEKWMAEHVGKIEAAALLGVGAAFDFCAGAKRRAPRWMQQSGLEWLFRLASEPRRLAHRYLIDNSIFLAMAVRHFTRSRAHN